MTEASHLSQREGGCPCVRASPKSLREDFPVSIYTLSFGQGPHAALPQPRPGSCHHQPPSPQPFVFLTSPAARPRPPLMDSGISEQLELLRGCRSAKPRSARRGRGGSKGWRHPKPPPRVSTDAAPQERGLASHLYALGTETASKFPTAASFRAKR